MNRKPLFKSTLIASILVAPTSVIADIQVIRKSVPITQSVSVATTERAASNTNSSDLSEVKAQPVQQVAQIQSNKSYFLTVAPHSNHALNAPIPRRFVSHQVYLKNPPSYISCFYASSRKYGVPVDLMFAIAQTESSFQHEAIGKLGYGTDHGLMQINDYWVPKLRQRFGITLQEIYQPCTNIDVAAWILAHNFVQHGTTWRAVGAYNAVTEWKREVYIKKVANNLKKIQAGVL